MEQGKDTSGSKIILQSIAITTPPTKTEYFSGESFNPAGMVVTGYYGTSSAIFINGPITNYSISPSVLIDNTTEVIITCSEGGRTYTATQAVTINPKFSNMVITTAPTEAQTYGSMPDKTGAIATITYTNGTSTTKSASDLTIISPVSVWNDIGSQVMTLQYVEDDVPVSANVAVTVNKATQTLSLTTNSVTLSNDNYSSGVTVGVNRLGTGLISVSGNVTGLTAVANDANIIVTGDGSTSTSTTFTVTVAEGPYYLGDSITFTAATAYWSWGSETTTADAAWWAGLQNEIKAGRATNSWVGKTKSVTLTSAILGTTTHLVRCIGVNQDGSNTVAFQTANALANYTPRGSTNLDPDSIGDSICSSYYNAFPGKAAIKTVSKGTCTYNASSPSYANKTVWLPSMCEVGLGSSEYAPKGSEYTQGCSAAYSYYTSNAARIKKAGDSGNALPYWLRGFVPNTTIGGTKCGPAVSYQGAASYSTVTDSIYIAPAFIIG